VTLNLSPLSSGDYEGMLLFMDANTGGDIILDSNNSINSTGTIYGANSSLVVNSNADITLTSQIIVKTMDVDSNGSIVIDYDQNSVFGGGPGDPTIQLAE
jgi:hypothetical protein